MAKMLEDQTRVRWSTCLFVEEMEMLRRNGMAKVPYLLLPRVPYQILGLGKENCVKLQ